MNVVDLGEPMRAQWPLEPNLTYLNHGSFGVVPRSVRDHHRQLRDQMERDPERWFSRTQPALVSQAASAVAQFLGVEAESLAFVANVTAGVSAVLASLDIPAGAEIIVTDHAYGAVRFAVDRYATRAGASVREVHIPLEARDEQIVALIEAATSAATALIVVDQVTAMTARIFPTAAITAMARCRGVPILIDAAHAPGNLPELFGTQRPDFWVGNLHKWVGVPRGTAALVVDPPWRETITHPIVSWDEHLPFPAPFHMQGTVDLTAWICAPRAIEYMSELGWDRIRTHNHELVKTGQKIVAASVGVDPAELPSVPRPLPIAIVPVSPGLIGSEGDCSALRFRLADEFQVVSGATWWHGHGFIRLCAQVYNTEADYRTLATALEDMLRSK